MKKNIIILYLLLSLNAAFGQQLVARPNVIIVYVDDLGYGDLGCYGAKGVRTPNVDALAKGGILFTDAHCTASTCTPSRFSLLTGSYAFRNKAAILPGDAPLLIRPGTPTIAGMFRKAGYKTGVIGKWHLGLGDGIINWNTKVAPGPLEIGFDYSFLVPATLDRVPCVFLQNHHVYNLDTNDPIEVDYSRKIGDYPTGLEMPQNLRYGADTQHSNTIINGISRIGYMSGGKAALWKDEEIANVLLEQVDTFLRKNKHTPFFLYFSFTDIHVPRAPHEKFVGKSNMGLRGDAIVQMDASVGELIKILKREGLISNTLILFTSDNGPVLDDGYDDKAVQLIGEHKPGGPFRGGKYSVYEAGTRVPTIISWPEGIQQGRSEALINQVDLYASFAKLIGQSLKPDEAPDSFNYLETWLGKSVSGRKVMLEEGFTMSLRNGDWKYIAPQTESTPAWLANKDIETGLGQDDQLYFLKNDPSEQHDIKEAHPQQLKKMKRLLKAVIAGASIRK